MHLLRETRWRLTLCDLLKRQMLSRYLEIADFHVPVRASYLFFFTLVVVGISSCNLRGEFCTSFLSPFYRAGSVSFLSWNDGCISPSFASISSFSDAIVLQMLYCCLSRNQIVDGLYCI